MPAIPPPLSIQVHRPILAALLALAVLAACVGAQRRSDRNDEARLPEDFTFRWRVPSTVAVVEITTTPRGTTELAYSAELVRHDDHLVLRHLDGEVRRLHDVVVGFDDRPRQLAATAHGLVDLTDAEIDADGQVIRCLPSPALRERASRLVEAQPKAQRTAYEIQLRDAATAALEASTCIPRWQSWVSAWIGFEALPGMPDEWHADRELGPGEEPKIRVTDTHLGDLPRGGVRVTRRQEIDGRALTGELAPLAAELTAERKSPIVSDRIVIQSATWLAIADLDPRTLRPTRIEWTRTLRLSLDGMNEERVTRRQWTFTFR